MGRLLTTTEAAKRLGVHPHTIRRAIASKSLKAGRLGGRGKHLIDEDDLRLECDVVPLQIGYITADASPEEADSISAAFPGISIIRDDYPFPHPASKIFDVLENSRGGVEVVVSSKDSLGSKDSFLAFGRIIKAFGGGLKTVAPLFALALCSQTVAQIPSIPPPVPPAGRSAQSPVVRQRAQTIPQQSQVSMANPGVIYENAPPVVINGKPATSLSDDELKEFLQEKISTLYQEPGDVELLKIAPGYALTLTFDTPVSSVVLGDPALVGYNVDGRTLVLSARQRGGDTDMQLIFGGGRILNYHIFIAPNFVSAQSTIRVVSSGGGDSSRRQAPYGASPADLDIAAIADVIGNYDALLSERAVDKSAIRRIPVFKNSDITSFSVYYIYLFKGGPSVVTFAYTNPFSYPIRYDESRLRIQVGNSDFIPDYVSIHNTELSPSETTTGFAVLADAPFKWDQPFELVWR